MEDVIDAKLNGVKALVFTEPEVVKVVEAATAVFIVKVEVKIFYFDCPIGVKGVFDTAANGPTCCCAIVIVVVISEDRELRYRTR